MTLNPSTIALVPAALFILWRIEARFRRSTGSQTFSRGRVIVTLVLYPLVLWMLARAAMGHPDREWMLAGGVALGVVLGIWGLRMTKFELQGEEMSYTPNLHLGIFVTLVFTGRIFYRMFEMYSAGAPASDFAQSPLTMLTFGLLAGYYITYALGLARQRSVISVSPHTSPELPARPE